MDRRNPWTCFLARHPPSEVEHNDRCDHKAIAGPQGPARARRGSLGRLVLISLLCGSVAPFGGGREDAWRAKLSGTFLVCKDCLTVRGTFLTDLYGKDIMRLNYLCGEDVDPRFCPADERILFASTRGGRPGLWSMNPRQQATTNLRRRPGRLDSPTASGSACRGGQIIERAIESGQETVRSPAGWNACRWPACSPDGRKVLFVASDGGKDWLMLATPGQTAPQRLAAGELPSARRWAPGGDRIVYQDGGHLWMIDADGQKRRQLTTAGGIAAGRRCGRPTRKPSPTARGPAPRARGRWR